MNNNIIENLMQIYLGGMDNRVDPNAFISSKDLENMLPVFNTSNNGSVNHLKSELGDPNANLRWGTTKRHADIMRDIRNLVAQLQSSPEMYNMYGMKNLFWDGFYYDVQGQQRPCIFMSVEGFQLLISGYNPIIRFMMVAVIKRIRQMYPGLINTLFTEEEKMVNQGYLVSKEFINDFTPAINSLADEINEISRQLSALNNRAANYGEDNFEEANYLYQRRKQLVEEWIENQSKQLKASLLEKLGYDADFEY